MIQIPSSILRWINRWQTTAWQQTGFFIVKWVIRKRCHSRADSFLMWDTVCGKGMSQEFTGAALLDREHNPTHHSGHREAQESRGHWRGDSQKRGQSQPRPGAAPSHSTSLPAWITKWIFPGLFYLKRQFPFPLCFISQKIAASLRSSSPSFDLLSCAPCKVWKQHTGMERLGGNVDSSDILEGSSKSCTEQPQQPHHVPCGWKEMERPVCPALTLVFMGWIFGGAGKGLVLSWGVIFALTKITAPACLIAVPHPHSGCTLMGLWLSLKHFWGDMCPIP